MKILFLHLSDSHFTEIPNININAIVSSLSQVGSFDECILAFSGDIVKSGEEKQFIKAGSFIGNLLKNISKKYLNGKFINTLVVPGNHDILAKNPSRSIDDLKSYYLSKPDNTEIHFCEDLKQLDNFYKFACRNYCFSKEKIIDTKTLKFGKFKIKANLINSAPFSLLCNGNEDKGLHYMPENELCKLDINCQENYTISIIHHSPEWFSDNSKQTLYEKLYESSDLIFVGHEHFSLSENKTINATRDLVISSGVALSGTKTEQGFNTILLDTEQKSLTGLKYIYTNNIYKPKPNLNKNNIIFKSKYAFKFTRNFDNFLEMDIGERVNTKYTNYFVFPAIEEKNINNEIKRTTIDSEEKFKELLSCEKKISIEGSSKSGKTILAKYLCRFLSEDYAVLYLSEDYFMTKDNDKIIRNCFLNQYGDEANFDQYVQLDNSKKILIVDGYDKIKKTRWRDFIDYCKDAFNNMILFCNTDLNLNIKEKTIEELSEDKIFYMKICPFYYAKREQLIHKICSLSPEHENYDITNKVKKINDDITNQIKYFQLNPDFIHQFVDYYLNFSHIKMRKENNVFSKVFEANIIFRIEKNTSKENIEEILIALDFVAYYIHFNKKFQLTFEEFQKAVNAYNQKYDNELSPKTVYDVAMKSNIIKEVPGKFAVEFCDENLLAYFTAMHLNRSFNEGEGTAELKFVLDNICFGINGDIILFLSYIASNVQVLTPILNSISEHMSDWEELSFDTKNIEYLSNVSTQLNTTLPCTKDKEKLVQEKNNMEKEFVEKKEKKPESIYSYDESKVNSFGNKISKSIEYLGLVAKILPNFRHMLTGEQKEIIVNILYIYPNRLLYFMLKDIDDNYCDIIDDILKTNPRTLEGNLITKDMVSKELENQSIVFILTIYDFIATTATNVKTISDLNKYRYDNNTNYELQNILMEENFGDFDQFSKKAECLYDKTNLNIVKQMLFLIVRKYFLHHNVAIVHEVQRVVDKFFGKDEKKNLQLLQAKSKIIKK